MPNPPASLDAERHLIGATLRDSAPFPAGLLPSDFYEPKHQDIAAAILSLEAEGITADELTVSMRLRDRKSVVDAFYVSELTSAVGLSQLNPAWSAEVIRASSLRLIGSTAARVAELAADPSADPAALSAYAEGSLRAVEGRSTPKAGPLRMTSDALMAFDRSNDPDCVLGNRWLCRAGSALIVSQAGVGKSSLMMQAAINWSIGGRRDFFGIKSNRPLRVAILQAENDLGDVAEAFQDQVAGAQLWPEERAALEENLAIYRDTTSVGPAFPGLLRDLIRLHRADLIFVDPLLSFAGIDIADQEQASRFLRHDLNAVLQETGCVLIAMHHTTKPRAAKDKEGQTIADLAYSGAGSSEFVNYFREVAVLVRQQGDAPVFKFGLTKRRGRARLKDAHGDFAGEIAIRHSRTPGEIRWEYATPDELAPPTADPSPAKAQPRRQDW